MLRQAPVVDGTSAPDLHRQLLDALDEPVIATDVDGRISYWNPATECLTGWTATEAVGRPVAEFLPLPVDAVLDRDRALSQGQRWIGVWSGARKDGTSLRAHLSLSPLRLDDGTGGGSVWRLRAVVPETVESVVDAPRAHDLEKELLLSVFENAPAFMAAFSGPDHVFDLVNNPYCMYTGRDKRELLGRPLHAVIPELADQGFIEVLDAVYRTGEPVVSNEAQVCLARTPLAPASCFYVNIVYQPRWSDEGTVIGVLVHGTDVTEQVESRELLRTAGRANQLVMDRSIDIICTVDREGRYRQVSRASESMWGYRPDELVGQHYAQFLHPDDRHTLHAIRDFTEAGGQLRNFRNRHLHRDGSVVEMMWASSWSEEDQCIFSVGRDITEMTRQEQELRARTDALVKSEQRFRSLVYATSQVVWTADSEYNWRELSNYWTELTGQTPADVASGGWQAVAHPDDLPRIHHAIAASQADGTPCTFEHRVRAADGTYRWLSTRIVPLLDEFGNHVECVGTCTDIDAQKRAEAALMASEARYRTMVDTASEGIWLIDAEARTTFMNARMAAMLGYDAARLKGVSLYDLVDEVDRDIMHARFRARAEGVNESYDIRFRNRHGQVVWAMVSASPFYDEHGRFAGSLGMITDITERKRNEIELRRAKEKAEEMSRLKSSFLANMSHEFRTPLTAIIGYADLLADEADEDARLLAQNIREGGERLLLTLDSVLALSQLESGSMTLSRRPVDVVQQVRDTLPMFVRQAREKGLSLRFYADPTAIHLPTDRGALSRIVSNLVDNAIKFTDVGSVFVRLREQDEGVVVEIEDTGIGMGDDFLNRLFEDFQQESSGMARAYEGIGLGLSISMRLVRLLGGTLAVESKKDVGTRVSVWLPR